MENTQNNHFKYQNFNINIKIIAVENEAFGHYKCSQ